MQDQHHGFRQGALRALIAAGLCLSAMGAQAQAATRGFTITSFDAIRVDAPVIVQVATGSGVSARAEGPQDSLDRLKVDVAGRLLIISMARPQPGERSQGAPTLRLTTGMIDRIVLTGGGSITVNRMKGLRGEIISGGNGDVTVDAVELDQMTVALAGGGRISLTGRAATASIRVNGPGAVAAQALQTRQATIANDGPGQIAVAADVTARVTASGSGDVQVSGKAACIVDNRGTGQVLCGGEAF